MLAVGRGRELVAVDVRDLPDRHGSHLMAQLNGVLEEAGIGMGDIEAIGVSSGPGSFTGLRVGLATAKTLAARRHLVLVGLATDEVLRRAAARSLGPRAHQRPWSMLPAGARDHYLALPGADPVLVPPDADMLPMIGVPAGRGRGRGRCRALVRGSGCRGASRPGRRGPSSSVVRPSKVSPAAALSLLDAA